MAFPQEDFSQLAAILESGSDAGSEEDEDDKEEALLQERDEAQQKLAELECASQALLAELLTLESEFEIEKSCRKQAEAYAAQVNREHKELKRISTAFLPLLSRLPEDLVDLGHGDESAAEAGPDPLGQYMQQIKDLQAKVSWLLEEKKELATRVKALQEQLEEERSGKRCLQAALEQSQGALQRVKQVSRLITQELGEVSRQLDVEQELRQQAEAFARQMLVKQKEANRQSRILIQSTGPDAQLLQALEDVARMTRALEEARQEHQDKVEDLEAQLAARPQLNELQELQAALAVAKEEKACLEKCLVHSEERNALLEGAVKSLEEKAGLTEAPSPELCLPAPPPPPPPLPPPAWPAPADPLSAIRQRRGARQAQAQSGVGADDFKAKAMDEMMARIRSGVVLRTAKQGAGALSKAPSAAAAKRRSAVMELQGLLSTTKRPVRKSSRRKGSQKRTDSQLEALLQRRRQILDCPGQPEAPSPQQAAGAAAYSPPTHSPRATAEPPSMPCATESRRSPSGDCDPAAAQSLPLSEERDSAVTRCPQRIAHLQTSRRTAPTPGARGTH